MSMCEWHILLQGHSEASDPKSHKQCVFGAPRIHAGGGNGSLFLYKVFRVLAYSQLFFLCLILHFHCFLLYSYAYYVQCQMSQAVWSHQ